MPDIANQAPCPESDEDLKQAVIESLDALDREGKLAVLEYSRELESPSDERGGGLDRLLDEWLADESGYDEEAWPEIKEALDRDRLSYRKLFVD